MQAYFWPKKHKFKLIWPKLHKIYEMLHKFSKLRTRVTYVSNITVTKYRILLLFHGLTSFLWFPEKFSQLPVTLLILGTLNSNIHGKTFAVTKRSAKTAKLFHRETKAKYGITFLKLQFIFKNCIIYRIIAVTHETWLNNQFPGIIPRLYY